MSDAWHPDGVGHEKPPDDPPACWPTGADIGLIRKCASLGCRSCRTALGVVADPMKRVRELEDRVEELEEGKDGESPEEPPFIPQDTATRAFLKQVAEIHDDSVDVAHTECEEPGKVTPFLRKRSALLLRRSAHSSTESPNWRTGSTASRIVLQ